MTLIEPSDLGLIVRDHIGIGKLSKQFNELIMTIRLRMYTTTGSDLLEPVGTVKFSIIFGNDLNVDVFGGGWSFS